jgi:hypothetical protein
VGDSAPSEGMANGEVDDGRDLGRHHDQLVVFGHVDEQLFQAHLCLLHASKGQHRGVVELGVVSSP